MSQETTDADEPAASRRELSVDMFVSADGFAADRNGTQGGFGGFGGPEFGHHLFTVLSRPQLMVLGRVTYELLSGFWPGSGESAAGPMNELPKLVFSRTLSGPLSWNACLASGDLRTEITTLKEQVGDPLRVIGSLTLARELVRLGLVDRLHLLVFPIVFGSDGTQPMFGGYPPSTLELLDSTVLDGSILSVDYRPVIGP